MNPWIEWIAKPAPDAQLTAMFLDALAKSFVVLGLAAGTCALWRGASSATRHLIWFVAVASLPCLPLLTASLPTGQKALWSVATGYDAASRLSLGLEFAPGRNPAASAPDPQPAPAPAENNHARREPSANHRELSAHLGANWVRLGFAVWGTGVALVLGSLVVGQLRLRRFSRRAHWLQNPDWAAEVSAARAALRLGRSVTLWQSAENVMPLTWGWWRPVVLLPAAAENWTAARRRLVLLHELAHVKRRDCLTQLVTNVICALYWFNPLVWRAAQQMRVERERACDDLVLNSGCKASDYAGHLVEIARGFRRVPQAAAIAMARPAGLEQRVAAILDDRRNRSRNTKLTMACLVVAVLSMGWLIGSYAAENPLPAWSLKNSTVADPLKRFVAEKQAQELQLIAADQKDFAESYPHSSETMVVPDCTRFFAAAAAGDWPAVTNTWSELEAHTLGLSKATNGYPHGMWLQPMRETFGAIEAFAVGNEKYSKAFADGVIQSIPPGSIYFGGTDPGRFIITALQKSPLPGRLLVGAGFTNFNGSMVNHIARLNPEGTLDTAFNSGFFLLTQNALADGTYLDYLRSMYEREIYIPTGEDSQKCFQDYVADAQVRLNENRLKPGEDIKVTQGRVQVSGATAVMEINALLVKIIFDKNPGREFFLEESFPLDWMYPNLEPHGFIFKINRQPLPELSDAMVQQDHAYWQQFVPGMIGGWLQDDTTVQEITAFAEKVFVRHDLHGFTGDPGFVQNDYSSRMFSKLRSAQAGLYAWRAEHATAAGERERMAQAADFAFRQALALCPASPEAAKRYAEFLIQQHREADAGRVHDLAGLFKPKTGNASAAPAKSLDFQIRPVVDAPGDDTEKMIQLSTNPVTGQVRQAEVYVGKSVLLDQTALQSAKLITGPQGDRQIEITFTAAGRKQFAKITREHLHQRLAIVIDGKLMEAPVIQSEITAGTCQIVGSFSDAEAKALAARINATAGK